MSDQRMDPLMRGARSVALSRRVALAATIVGASSLLTGCKRPHLETGGPMGLADLATVLDGPATAPVSATLMMVGDMLIHQGVWVSGQRSDGTYNFDHFFAQLADEFSQADIAVVNQETILGGTERGLESFPYFNSPQELGDAEAKAGVDVAVSATNHALDHGFDGICWTLDYWRSRHPEMAVPGIADSQEVADAPLVIERNGIKFGLLSYAEHTNSIPIPDNAPFCVKTLKRSDFGADVAAAREAGADIVIAFPHWGTEYVYTPDSDQLRWAPMLAEAGVDAIIGTHPHVIEPLELIDGLEGRRVPVFWSLGNFVSWQIEKPRMLGGMAKLQFGIVDGEVRVTSCSLEPVVTHKALDPSMTVYRLADYTEELAAANYVRQHAGCGDFSAQYCRDLAAQVLGPDYDPDACIVSYEL